MRAGVSCRAQEFASGLILLSVNPDSFRLVAAMVLVRDFTSALGGASLGSYVDR